MEVVVGTFIMRYFYEPAVTALSAVLGTKSAAFNLNNASKISWPLVESLLTVYRATREIGESV
jgi:hypothetical protein